MREVIDTDDISEDDFDAFEDIRQMGICNMLSPQVRELAGFSKATHAGIIRHYEELRHRYILASQEGDPE